MHARGLFLVYRGGEDTVKGLRTIQPYVPGEQPKLKDIIKLNTNENAYPPSPRVTEAWQTFDPKQLRYYSALANPDLVKALADKHQVPSQWITTTNGSDDSLALAFQSFFQSDDPIVFPDLTYGFYSVWCELFHIPYQEVPLAADFTFDLSHLPEKIGGIVLANPNAPTGIGKPAVEIENLLQAYPDCVVIVDEAYQAFGGESVIPLVEKYDNLYVTRTFSKDAALAGLRVGYGIGGERLTGVIQAVKNSYNPYAVDSIAEHLATIAAKDVSYYEEINQKICATRADFIAALSQLGFITLPSQTNFVLTTHPLISAQLLFETLKAATIFVRYFPEKERIANYLRITIGTDEEMAEVVTVLKKVIEETT